MSFGRKRIIFAVMAATLGGAAVLPMATGFAFETEEAPIAESDGELIAAAGVDAAPENPFAAVGATEEPVIELDDAVETAEPEQVSAEEATVAINDTVDAELLCLAKIVRHEAANQSRQGQLAVAQLVMNRVNSPRFPNTICGVAHQRGQFFNTNAYNPSRNTAQWRTAVEVAIDARNAISDPVVADAVFYHAAYVTPRFHRSRPRVAQIEDHIFYR